MSAECKDLECFLDGRLEAPSRAAFEAHLTACATCQSGVAQWERTGQLLEAWAAPFSGPPSAAALRHFRQRAQRPRQWVPVTLGLSLATAAAVTLVFFFARGGPTEWDLALEEGSTTHRLQATTLGSPDEDLRFRLGPDRLEVMRASEVDVLDKSVRRTRLRLRHGKVVAQVEPGHRGRQFIVESEPFRVTVVGTVFEASRDARGLHVATREGIVQIDRLAASGAVLETHRLSAGSTLSLETAPAPSAEVNAHGSPDAGPPDVEFVAPTAPRKDQLLAWRKRAARGECEAVLEEAEAVLRRLPSHPGTLRVAADCARKLHEPERAVAMYRRLMKATEGQQAAEALLLAVSLTQDELHDAEATVKLTQDLRRQRASAAVLASLHLRRASALRALGRQTEASREIDLILSTYSSTPAAAEALRLRNDPRKH